MDIIITKTCNRCHREKSLSNFSKSKRTKDGFGYQCKVCDSENCKRYYREHVNERMHAGKIYREENPETYRKSRYKLRYGISLDDYNRMSNDQGGVCSICFRSEKRYKYLVIDHDHKTGKVRGLICSKCNNALGCVDDNIDTLINMIEYLKRSGLTAQYTALPDF
jgi:hypothetical protein